MLGGIIYPFPHVKGCTVEIWEWVSNFIPYFTGHVITYPCCDLGWTMVLKGFPDVTLTTRWNITQFREVAVTRIASYCYQTPWAGQPFLAWISTEVGSCYDRLLRKVCVTVMMGEWGPLCTFGTASGDWCIASVAHRVPSYVARLSLCKIFVMVFNMIVLIYTACQLS